MTKQIAKTISIPAAQVPYLNWQRIGDERATLACHFEAVLDPILGDLTLTWYWDREPAVTDADDVDCDESGAYVVRHPKGGA